MGVVAPGEKKMYHVWGKEDMHTNFGVWKPQGKSPFGRTRRSW